MNIRIVLLGIVFIVSGKCLFAQAPGFMGKRMVIGYGFHFSPAFIGATAQNQSIFGDGGSAETGVLAFNALHEGYLEYATSHRFMAGLSCKYYRTAYDNAFSLSSNYSSSNIYNQNVTVYGRPGSYYEINGITVALYGKLYSKRYVAPWGRYIVFGPVLNIRNTKHDKNEMRVAATQYNSSYYSEDITVSNFGSEKQTFYGFNILFGCGRNRMIGKRVTLDYGFNTQVIALLSTMLDLVFADSDVNLYKVKESNYIQRTSGQRIRGLNRFNAYLKIGFML